MSPDTLDAPGTATSGAMTGAVPAPAEQAHDPRARLRKHKALVYSLRVLVLVGVLAFWEFSVRLWLDPFFYSQPSLIWKKLVTWFTDGTAQGPVWEQIWYTLQEAVYGFLIGAIAGVLLGILLGRARLLAEVLSPYIQAANAVPRIVLAALFIIW